MHFSDDYIEQIKLANPLIELLQEHTELKKNGNRYRCRCPFPDHEDKKSPSMTVFEDGTAFCFGCKTNLKDSIDFVIRMNNVSFQEAVVELARRAGIPLPEEDEEFSRINALRKDMMNKARRFWINLMKDEKYVDIRNYLINERGLTEELIAEFKIGFCNGELLEDEEYRKFTNRIIFPIFNHYGEICGFSGRVLPSNEDKYAKYVNSSENNNPLFKKRELIYGLDIAKQYIRQEGFAIWVEGYMDVIIFHKYGIKNVVAGMGTAISEEQVRLIKKFTDEIILYLDSDESGIRAMLNSLDLFDKHNLLLKIVEGKRGYDPAEMANELKEGCKPWLIQNAKTIEQYFTDKFLNEYNIGLNNLKRGLLIKVGDVFKNRLNRIETEIALSSICDVLNVSVETLKREIENIR